MSKISDCRKKRCTCEKIIASFNQDYVTSTRTTLLQESLSSELLALAVRATYFNTHKLGTSPTKFMYSIK
jgi:hypothetical protein